MVCHGGVLNLELAIVACRRVCAPLPPCLFVEDDVSIDVDAACHWIIDPVSLGARLIPEKDHGLAAVVELLQVWPDVLDMGHAPECPQVMYRRCGPIPQLIWCFATSALCHRPVEDVDCSVDGLPPRTCR